MTHDDILSFWFTELSADEWFHGGEKVDQVIRGRFTDMHRAAAAGECWEWRDTPAGVLAEVIALDQFSRNIYRGTPEAFAYDGQALVLAQVAVARGYDALVSETERPFLYLPYMHSESAVIHEEALRLFTALGSEEHLKFERIHKDIIDRFGRYPHRNAILGRTSTPDEAAFLAETDYSFYAA